jgi:ribosomal protein L31
LLRQAEETTCFQGASSLTTETACHGSSSSATTNRIQTVITRTYKHPTTTISGVHTNLDVLYPTGGTPAGSKGLDWSTSKHAECVDCHNPHKAKQGSHTPAAQWYPTTVTATTNNVSNALTGVTGVEPGSATKWTVPTTFTTLESSTYEYQICYKCHSYWALRDADGITTYTTASGATVTDQAMEFNPNNYSAHPVEVTLNNQAGSYAPKALASSQMSAPWTAVGNQTMYCSDCHGADNEASGDPKGPHGSNVKYMLKGTGKYWPTNSSGTLWVLNTTDASNTALFCKNCHPIYDGRWKNGVHSKGDHSNIACVACHLVVPHGGKRSRLIAYTSDLSPYDYNNNTARLNGFKKASSPSTYSKPNCYSTYTGCTTHNSSTCGGSGCDP